MEKQYPFNIWKHCPRCGREAFQKGDGNFMSCRSCSFRFFINAAAATAALIEDDCGRLLFTVRKREPAGGMLDLPGGFVDLHESAEEALTREVKEELNLDISHLDFFCSRPNEYLFDGIVYHVLDLLFRCRVVDFSPIRAADDVADFRFLHLNNLDLDEIAFPSTRAALARLRDMPSRNVF